MRHSSYIFTVASKTSIRSHEKGCQLSDLSSPLVRVELEISKSLAQLQREYRQRKKFNFLNIVTRDEKSR